MSHANRRWVAMTAGVLVLAGGCRLAAPARVAASTVTIDGGPPPASAAHVDAPPIPAPTITPVTAPPADAVNQLALGNGFACALRASGFVDCWGAVPDPNHAIVLEPYRVGGVSDAVQIAARGDIMCARSRAGAVSCLLGWDHDGTPGRPSAVPIEDMNDALDIAVASGPNSNPTATVCARTRGAARPVKCWSEWTSRLGSHPHAQVVRNLPPARELFLNAELALEGDNTYGCILDDAGAMHCWSMAPESIGPDAPSGSRFGSSAPWRVGGLPPLEHAAVRWKAGAGIRKDDHRAITWAPKKAEETWPPFTQPRMVKRDEIKLAPALDGADTLITEDCGLSHGQVVCMEETASKAPSKSARSGVLRGAVALSDENGCLVGGDGRVLCWGTNDRGVLAAPTTIPFGAPAPVTVVELNHVIDIAVTDALSCGLRSDGEVSCWGAAMGSAIAGSSWERARLTKPRRIGRGVQALSGGGGTICELLAPDHVECLARISENAFGELVRYPGVQGVRTMSGSSNGIYLTLDDGRILDLERYNVVARPTHPTGLRAPSHDCAIERAAEGGPSAPGRVVCLVESDPSPGWRAKGIDDARTLVSGQGFMCTLHGTGTVSCWGYSVPADKGWRGVAEPAPIPELADAVDLVAGKNTICVRTRDGDIRCLGTGENNGAPHPHDFKPSAFASALRDVTRIALATTHGCALRRDGLVVCFGRNYQGELGDGSISSADAGAPIAVPLR